MLQGVDATPEFRHFPIKVLSFVQEEKSHVISACVCIQRHRNTLSDELPHVTDAEADKVRKLNDKDRRDMHV